MAARSAPDTMAAVRLELIQTKLIGEQKERKPNEDGTGFLFG
jgi:hypothetical protein